MACDWFRIAHGHAPTTWLLGKADVVHGGYSSWTHTAGHYRRHQQRRERLVLPAPHWSSIIVTARHLFRRRDQGTKFLASIRWSGGRGGGHSFAVVCLSHSWQ